MGEANNHHNETLPASSIKGIGAQQKIISLTPIALFHTDLTLQITFIIPQKQFGMSLHHDQINPTTKEIGSRRVNSIHSKNDYQGKERKCYATIIRQAAEQMVDKAVQRGISLAR